MFETLSQTLDAATDSLMARGGVIKDVESTEDEIRLAITQPFQFGGIPYGQCKEGHYPLETLKGKRTKKYFHVVITRMDSGRYELVEYVL